MYNGSTMLSLLIFYRCWTASAYYCHPIINLCKYQTSPPLNFEFAIHQAPEYTALKCIDGDAEGRDNMCHSRGERAPWLAVDFGRGAAVTVERVEIFNRDDCCGDRTRHVDVLISNHSPTTFRMFSRSFLHFGHFVGPATNGQQITISGEDACCGLYNLNQFINLPSAYYHL